MTTPNNKIHDEVLELSKTENNEPRFTRRKTFHNFENAGYRGNFEVPPKDTKACFYSTAGGFFYPKRNVSQEKVTTKHEPLRTVSKTR
jgi:hypothetical protein